MMEKKEIEANQPTCFVVMGFGKKTDFETGRTLDLDKSYKNIIKPAVEAAGLRCIRADEIVHSGLIDVPMYEQLLKADVVVADLSTSNKNALYELGVRHALRPFSTVVIAEDGIKAFPFDINHVLIRQYHHLGEDIGYDEAMRFRKQLTKVIQEILKKDPREKDSPIYTLLKELSPPALAAVVQAKVQETIDAKGSFEENTTYSIPSSELQTHSILMHQVDEAQKKSDWNTVRNLLSFIRQTKIDEMKRNLKGKKKMVGMREDPYILQRLALATYKSRFPNEIEALKEAHKLLNILNPSISNDTETLGLWGAVHKRLWVLEKKHEYLDEAIRTYERGFYIKNDYYNGINLAFLLNIRADQADERADAIADFVQARRIRKEVLSICEQWLKDHKKPKKNRGSSSEDKALIEYTKNWYWVKATMAEAYLGLDKEIEANKALEEAYKDVPEAWMQKSTEEQLEQLRMLIQKSPLRYIKGSNE